MPIIDDWQLQDKIETCHGCGTEFTDGAEVTSALYEEEESFVRHDYCATCWTEERLSRAFSHRRTLFSNAKPMKAFVDDEVLFNFFERLKDSDESSKQDFCYVLALMLMRKRWLKFVSVEKEGDTAWMILRCPRRDADYRVRDRRLSPEELERLNEEVAKIFVSPPA